MKYVVVIPAHNEAAFLPGLLASLFAQTVEPNEVVLVNDHSTDETQKIMQAATKRYRNTHFIHKESSAKHLPGAKVVDAFNAGLKAVKSDYDILVKLDADLILPPHYFETVLKAFELPKTGIVGGFCYEQDATGEWKLNHPMQQDHVRGAFKAYHYDCFQAMGGLRSAMGWDTIDELLARFYGYDVKTLAELKVKHLRPVGSNYKVAAGRRQGQAFYRMRYGGVLSFLAALKSGWSKKSLTWSITVLRGYFESSFKHLPFLVDEAQGKFIRAYRWKRLGKR